MTHLSFDLPTRRFPDLSEAVEQQFLKFHSEHPEVYELFKKYAYEARRRFGRYSVNGIFEAIRWETHGKFSDGQFKLNNNLRSAFARKLIEDDESFRSFFEIRHSPGSISEAA